LQEKGEVNTDIPNSKGEGIWFTEYGPENTALSLKIKRKIFERETLFQKIEVFDSYDYGRVLVLDGFIMLGWSSCRRKVK
jgi:spermidine synthase